MRLNLDCVRSVLLCVEENSGLRTRCVFVDSAMDAGIAASGLRTREPMDYQMDLLEEYDSDEILYHVRYCIEAELVAEAQGSSPYIRTIVDLTPKGHDFLANIRDSKIWGGIKSVAAKVGSQSLDAVVQISSNVISELIKAQFGLR